MRHIHFKVINQFGSLDGGGIKNRIKLKRTSLYVWEKHFYGRKVGSCNDSVWGRRTEINVARLK